MSKLSKIYDFLIECGVDAEIRSDRISSYVNVGNVKSVRNRMQFWIPKNRPDEVHMYVGTEMGKWYSESKKSVYWNPNYRYTFKENEVRFPDMKTMMSFVKRVSEM